MELIVPMPIDIENIADVHILVRLDYNDMHPCKATLGI